MINRIKEKLLKEHEGSEGLEGVLVSPIMFVSFVILLMFFFTILTYISWNNVANTIAQELNMRQTGYESTLGYSFPRVLTYQSDGTPSAYLSSSDVTIAPANAYLAGAVNFALDKHKEQFIIPFAEVEKIRVITAKEINPAEGRRMAGNVISVEIDFSAMKWTATGNANIPMTAHGYNIIS